MDNELIYEYSDELNDDFANNKINKKSLNDTYDYFSKNPFFHLVSFLFRYLIAIPVLWFMDVFIFRVRFKNKKVLKKAKKKGYYVYSNHVLPLDPVIPPVMTNPTKFMVIVASHDTFSINPIVSFLVKCLGAIPVPSNTKMYKNYTTCMSYHIKKKHRILIYPEAHIWPYYTGIRNFKSSSFRYPFDDNAPCFAFTTTFKKSKFFKKPSKVVYIDGPFYPNKELDRVEGVNKLRDHVYEAMVARSKTIGNYSYIKYIKKDKAS